MNNSPIIDSIKKNKNLLSITEISDNKYLIKRKKWSEVILYIIEWRHIKIDLITNLSEIDFLLIPSKEWESEHEAMELLSEKTYSYWVLRDIHNYIEKNLFNEKMFDEESEFIIKNITKHTKVDSIIRISQNEYKLTKINWDIKIILSIYDYDFSRSLIERNYDPKRNIDYIRSRHPYAKISKDAEELSKSINVPICMWRDILWKLNV